MTKIAPRLRLELLLAIVTVIGCLALHAQTPSGFIAVSGTRLVDVTGVPISNAQLCAQVVASKNSAYSTNPSTGGQTTKPPVCVAVTAGHFAINLPNTNATSPQNACIAITVIDNATQNNILDTGYNCVQPTDASPSTWCFTSSGTTTCNFDLYKPNLPMVAVVQTGPQGAAGLPGAAGAPLTFKGVYSGSTTYAVGDGVSFGGLNYISLVSTNSGHQPDISGAYWGPFSIYNQTACPLTDGQNICITSPPYYGSPAGATTTTLTASASAGNTMTVASCSTWSLGNGVYVPSTGYLGKVSSCAGSTLIVTPNTTASIASGATVMHDETAAIQSAIVALTPLGGGSIHYPIGTYNLNGPLQDTSGANSIIVMPSIPNYTGTFVSITMNGLGGQSKDLTYPVKFVTIQNAGSMFSGYAGGTGGNIPPFTNAGLFFSRVGFTVPQNPNITAVDATNLLAAGMRETNIYTINASAGQFATGTGSGFLMPKILNEFENYVDKVNVAGFPAQNIRLTEHAQVGSLWSQYSPNCVSLDNGTRTAPGLPGTYAGNSIAISYLWAFNCQKALVGSGNGPTTVSILNFDSELNYVDIYDPSNTLYGHVFVLNPYDSDGHHSAGHPINRTGATNLNFTELWTGTEAHTGTSPFAVYGQYIQNSSTGAAFADSVIGNTPAYADHPYSRGIFDANHNRYIAVFDNFDFTPAPTLPSAGNHPSGLVLGGLSYALGFTNTTDAAKGPPDACLFRVGTAYLSASNCAPTGDAANYRGGVFDAQGFGSKQVTVGAACNGYVVGTSAHSPDEHEYVCHKTGGTLGTPSATGVWQLRTSF